MKNEDAKRELVDLKRQIESLNYYLSTLRVIEDRKSKENLYHAQQTARGIDRKIVLNIRKLEEEIHDITASEIDEARKLALGTINSPSANMKKAVDFNMNARKFGAYRNNLLKEASNNFINMIRTAKERANEKRTGSQEEK